MTSVVNEINEEIDQGVDLKQVFRGDLPKKIAFEVKDESQLCKESEERFPGKGISTSLMWERASSEK